MSAGPIPTCVGQPVCQVRKLCMLAAYPHVCGATRLWLVLLSVDKGLSPRVWGNQAHRAYYRHYRGPIPTCVGQPYASFNVSILAQAYPHVCGATVLSPPCALPPSGLSPRVWGNLV